MSRLVAILALAAACAHSGRQVGEARPDDPSWPRDGGLRIAYAGELHEPDDVGIQRGFFARVWRFITGNDESDELYRPYAVAVAEDGRIAVADPGRRAVHVFDRRKHDYLRIKAQLRYPAAVVFIGSTLLVADADARTLAAFHADGNPAPLPVEVPPLQRPAGLALDARRGVLYLSDSAAHRVYALPLGGGQPRSVGGRGSALGELNFPTHLAVDGAGSLYVCDAMNFRIQIFDADLRPLRTFGQGGDALGDLPRPKGLAVDREGHVLIVEGYFDLVQVFSAEGELLGVFGGSGNQPGKLWLPGGAAIEGHNLFVADTFNARVQVYDLERRTP